MVLFLFSDNIAVKVSRNIFLLSSDHLYVGKLFFALPTCEIVRISFLMKIKRKSYRKIDRFCSMADFTNGNSLLAIIK